MKGLVDLHFLVNLSLAHCHPISDYYDVDDQDCIGPHAWNGSPLGYTSRTGCGITSNAGCGIYLKSRLWGLPQKQVLGFTSKAGCGV